MGFASGDKCVAACTVRIGDATGNGHDFAVVVRSKACCDEAAAVGCTLHHNGGVGESRDDAVASHEIDFFDMGAREMLCQESALSGHLCRALTMRWRVNLVQSVRQHADGLHACCQARAVGVDVCAVGQSADDDAAWRKAGNAFHQSLAERLPVGCNLARADDGDHVGCVEIGCAAIEQMEWPVAASHEAMGIAFLTTDEYFDIVGIAKRQLLLSTRSGCGDDTRQQGLS